MSQFGEVGSGTPFSFGYELQSHALLGLQIVACACGVSPVSPAIASVPVAAALATTFLANRLAAIGPPQSNVPARLVLLARARR
jgi:hypothetical protein